MPGWASSEPEPTSPHLATAADRRSPVREQFPSADLQTQYADSGRPDADASGLHADSGRPHAGAPQVGSGWPESDSDGLPVDSNGPYADGGWQSVDLHGRGAVPEVRRADPGGPGPDPQAGSTDLYARGVDPYAGAGQYTPSGDHLADAGNYGPGANDSGPGAAHPRDAGYYEPGASEADVGGEGSASPRHGRPLGWYSSGAAEMTNEDTVEFAAPASSSASPGSIASAEQPFHGAPAPMVSDGPMIAGSYLGAERAHIESEDEVAIPVAPDASADTPIARAAQAAMKARSVGGTWPRPRSCRILTIANQKGGVGKTTTAVNLAASLAMHGSRVLVVDLDPQGNASTALDVEHRSGTQSIYNVLVDGLPLTEVVKAVQGFPTLHCAPATIDLAGAEIELVPLVARESRLSRAVTEYDASNLDYIFIDCPPSLGLLTVNALVAAPEVLIPIQCEYYALEGLEQLLRTVDLVKNHLNPNLKVSTILLTMFDSRTRLASQVADEVRSHFSDMVLQSVIPRSVRVSEAPSYGQSVMTYDPGSSGALAYLEAAKEMAFKNTPAATA